MGRRAVATEDTVVWTGPAGLTGILETELRVLPTGTE